jgi:hypothetical protein
MRSTTLVLAAHSLRRTRAILIGMALVLGGFQFLLTQVASFLFRSGGFSLMPSLVPDFLRQMAGPSMLTFMSFVGVMAFGYFHPIVIAAHLGLAIAIATEPAAEVERRFADLTLARPLARHQVITRTVLVLVAASAVRRRATASGVAAVAALAAYLLDYLGRIWDSARWLSTLSPFHYFEPSSLVSGAPLNLRDVAVLLGIGLAGTIAGYVIFSRRDV